MFGEGISLDNLLTLLRVIREHSLTLQVKVTNEPWKDLSPAVMLAMIGAISSGKIRGTDDIRLRLFAKT